MIDADRRYLGQMLTYLADVATQHTMSQLMTSLRESGIYTQSDFDQYFIVTASERETYLLKLNRKEEEPLGPAYCAWRARAIHHFQDLLVERYPDLTPEPLTEYVVIWNM